LLQSFPGGRRKPERLRRVTIDQRRRRQGATAPEYKLELGVTVQVAFGSDLHQVWTNLIEKSVEATGERLPASLPSTDA
jgi:hypothetical protein